MSDTAEIGAVPPQLDADTPHVLVVDDDRRLRQLLKRYLGDNGFRVTTAQDAAEARRALDSLSYDLIVLDRMMPGEDGLSLTRSLRRISHVPILLLTARTDADDRIAGLESGADDYLGKPFEPRELLLRISTILRRVSAQGGGTAEEIAFGECRFNPSRGELTIGGKLERLTTREVQLLRLFCTNAGKVLTRLDIGDNDQAERSIDVQINRLRRKIEPDPRNPIYLQTVRGEGYVFQPD